MRKKLSKINGERTKFFGKFERIGSKSGWKGKEKTVLIKDISDQYGTSVADHIWFNYTKGFQNIYLNNGDLLEFEARVKEYEKGYKGSRLDVDAPVSRDYKLSHPSKIRKCEQQAGKREKYLAQNLENSMSK